MEVVINTCYGGFCLSQEALDQLYELKSEYVIKNEGELTELKGYHTDNDPLFRSDNLVIQVVKELGKKSWGNYAKLKIINIPDDVKWEINEYDGMEEIREISRSWD